MDDDRSTAVGEKRVRVAAKVYVLVLELRVGFAFGVDGEIFNIAGVMAFGIVESVLFPIGIEVRAGGFKIRSGALGILMEVDRVFTRREAVEVKLQRDTCSLLGENDRSYGFALRIFEFYYSFGGAGQRGENQNGGQSDEIELWMFHTKIIAKSKRGCTFGPCRVHTQVEYTSGKVLKSFREKVQSWRWTQWNG